VIVDEVEKMTGLDFFDNKIENNEEENIESKINKKLWKVTAKRYQLRINIWNHE